MTNESAQKIVNDWNQLVPLGVEIDFKPHKDAQSQRGHTTGLAFIEDDQPCVFMSIGRKIIKVRLSGSERIVVG